MIRYLSLIFLSFTLYASDLVPSSLPPLTRDEIANLNEKIQNLVGEDYYNGNKNFIEKLFKDKQSFYIYTPMPQTTIEELETPVETPSIESLETINTPIEGIVENTGNASIKEADEPAPLESSKESKELEPTTAQTPTPETIEPEIKPVETKKEIRYFPPTLDLLKILQTLRDNGLLKLKFDTPSDLVLNFSAKIKPIFLIKNLNSALSSVGFAYFSISKAVFDGENSKISVTIATEHALNPIIMLKELQKRGYFCKDIRRDGNFNWDYSLVQESPIITDSYRLAYDQLLVLKEVSGEYWVNVDLEKLSNINSIEQNTLSIASDRNWRPRVVVFDANLNIINLINKNILLKNLKIPLPSGTKFIFITDSISPLTLKNGIKLELTR